MTSVVGYFFMLAIIDDGMKQISYPEKSTPVLQSLVRLQIVAVGSLVNL